MLRAELMRQAGGVLADLRWGKFRTIAIGTGVAGIAHILSVYGMSVFEQG